MARPKKESVMEIVSVRLPTNMLKEIDAYIDAIKNEMPLLNIGRGDGIRQLIADGLAARGGKGRKKQKS
jgi:hypothetical protein